MDLPGADGEAFEYAAEVVAGRRVRVVFGTGSSTRIADEVREWGTRALLIAGRRESAAADGVASDLGVGVVARIDEVVQHVPVEVAEQAGSQARAASADVLIAIGGGSATGLAKAVALKLALPVLAVPTTYAGSEMTAIWGRTDTAGKTTGRAVRVLPRTVIYDPALTTSMPSGLTAASGMNALAHAVESLFAPDRTDHSRLVAVEAIRSLAEGVPGSVANPGDLAARGIALRGAWLAGWSLGSTSMGLHHSLAHLLGGSYRLAHAPTHSALLPQVAGVLCARAASANPDDGALWDAAEALGVPHPARLGEALFDLAVRISAPTSLRDAGLDADRVEQVIADVAQRAAGAVSEPEIALMLRRAYEGVRPDPEGRAGAQR